MMQEDAVISPLGSSVNSSDHKIVHEEILECLVEFSGRKKSAIESELRARKGKELSFDLDASFTVFKMYDTDVNQMKSDLVHLKSLNSISPPLYIATEKNGQNGKDRFVQAELLTVESDLIRLRVFTGIFSLISFTTMLSARIAQYPLWHPGRYGVSKTCGI